MTFNEIVTYFSLKGAVRNSMTYMRPGCNKIKIKLTPNVSAYVSYKIHGEMFSPFRISVCHDDALFFKEDFSCYIKENIPSILEMYIK